MALVTGGGSGICFEVTRQLLQHGARGAVICGRRASFLERAAAILSQDTGADVRFKVCDVRNPDQCQAAVDFVEETFGKLDILVNGAAGNFLAQAKDLSPRGFATVMAIDAQGTFNMCRASHRLLSQSRDSVVSDFIIFMMIVALQSIPLKVIFLIARLSTYRQHSNTEQLGGRLMHPQPNRQ